MGLRVNFSDKEASSEARDFDVLPAGAYLVAITDVEVRQSQSEKHNGKPYFAFEFTIQEDAHDGKYKGRKAWGNVMLFPGALYSLAQMMKAVWNRDIQAGEEIEIPEGDEWLGKTVVITGTLQNKKDKAGNVEYSDAEGKVPVKRYEIKGYKSSATWNATEQAAKAPTQKKSSLLP